MLDGKVVPWHGMNGMAGEYGHVTVNPRAFPAAAAIADAPNVTPLPAPSWIAKEVIATGHAPALAAAASSDPEFGPPYSHLQPRDARRRTLPPHLPHLRTLSRHHARRHRQRLQPRYVCPRRRCCQRLGRLAVRCSRTPCPLFGLRRNHARQSPNDDNDSSKRKKTGKNPVPARQTIVTRAQLGQRYRTLRCGARSRPLKLKSSAK